nr:hypothetical protein [Tanacetum cinerariifolium]
MMLLRNIDQANGLCNGTRLQVLKLTRTSISAHIVNETNFAKKVIIPRLRITLSDKRLLLKIVRKKLPLLVSFAMTINKNQSQSLSKVGLYFPRPISLGQLYSVVLRVKSKIDRKVVVCDEDDNISKNNTNVVYKEVLQAGGHDMVNTTIVPISRIFDCFRSLGSNPLGSDSISQTGGADVSSSVDVQIHGNEENNHVSQENVGKHERPSVDVQMIGNGRDVSTRLSTRIHDVLCTTTVLVSTIFDCLRNMRLNPVGSDYTGHADVLGYTASSLQMASVNHAYLCMDLTDYIIRPEIISFPNNSAINVYQNHCLPSTTVQFLELKKVKIHVSHDLHKLECITKLLLVGMYQDDLKIRDKDTLNPKIVEGLIHVLNEHNGLVRLFRTAQDICSAGEVPSFKIRLYNKGGVHGYELLTSDILGGIVFEDGPNSRTDFDVIIEFKGGPPQRINKLHQSYMFLQFPLLFIFDQPRFFPDLILKPRDGT